MVDSPADSPPPSSPPELAPSEKDTRIKEAAARRRAAEEARKAQLLAKQAAKQRQSVDQEVPSGVTLPADDAGDGFATNALLEPTEKEKRAALVAQRRQALEEAKKAELLQKRQAKAEKKGAGSSADQEVARLECLLADLPAGRAGDASRAGLKKQLQTAKAIVVREQRKREMAEREAKKAQQLQQSRPPSAPAEVDPV